MKHSAGSALLVTLTVLGLVSSIVMHLWFVTSFDFDVAAQRVTWYKNFYATELALNIGLTQIKTNFSKMLQRAARQDVTVIDLTNSVPLQPYEPNVRVLLLVQLFNKGQQRAMLSVTTQRWKGQECLCTLRCLLEKRTPDETNKQPYFMASHFTVGTSL